MATLAVVPLSEYLSHTYEPDCDFVDGELEERNVGEEQHSELQGILAGIFRNMRLELLDGVCSHRRVGPR